MLSIMCEPGEEERWDTSIGFVLRKYIPDAIHESIGAPRDSIRVWINEVENTDFLAGTGSSKFEISDTNNTSYPVYHVPDWGAATDLCFKRFLRKGLIDNAEFHQVNTFAALSGLYCFNMPTHSAFPCPHIRHRHRW